MANPSSYRPSEPARPRRAGITTAQPRCTKNCASGGKSIGRVNRLGSGPRPVDPWLKTSVSASPSVAGL
jgi:hypothetical protein